MSTEITGSPVSVPQEVTDALLFALYDMRFMWATHAEECQFVRSCYKLKCDCDWPIIQASADAAIMKATGTSSLDEAISAVRKKRAPPESALRTGEDR